MLKPNIVTYEFLKKSIKATKRMPLKDLAAKFNREIAVFLNLGGFRNIFSNLKLLSRLALKTGIELMCACSGLIFTT